MKLSEYIKHTQSFFSERDIQVSKTAIKALKNERYLNQNLLEEMSEKDVLKNMKILLDDILKIYKSRAEKTARVRVLRDIDVRPVLKKKYCNLPPLCKNRRE